MRSRKGPITLIVLGAPLSLGPLLGAIGTVVGMTRAFNTLAGSARGPVMQQHLASDISVSLFLTVAGYTALPIGLILLAGGIVWHIRIDKAEKADREQVVNLVPDERR